jgi:asparagine synthase (glutamine-hydrolysing)
LDASRELHLGSADDYAERFQAVVTEAVRCRLRSASPVTGMLSGGLDSSSIVGTASRILRDSNQAPLLTLSTVFDQLPACDEREFIRSVLAATRCAPSLIPFDHDSHRPVGAMATMMQWQDEPFFAPNAAQPWQLFDRAGATIHSVVLDGHGGDEVVSHGQNYLKELARRRQWLSLAREIGAVARQGETSFFASYAKYVRFGLGPSSGAIRRLRQLWRTMRRHTGHVANSGIGSPRLPTASSLQFIAPPFAARLGLAQRAGEFAANAAVFTSVREDHWRVLSDVRQAAALETLDTLGNAHSLELRFPFWDRRMVELCLMLPAVQKYSRGWGRLILRRSMKGVLPNDVRWRRDKTDFMPNVLRGVQQNESAEIERIAGDFQPLAEFVDMTALRALCRRAVAAPLSSSDFFSLSRLASLRYWLEGETDVS